jgi:hypothetical protein
MYLYRLQTNWDLKKKKGYLILPVVDSSQQYANLNGALEAFPVQISEN